MRQRLFAVTVFAGFHRRDRDRRVRMIGRGDNDSVDFLAHFVEHHAEISKPPGLRKPGAKHRRSIIVDVAQSNDVLALHQLEIGFPLIAKSNAGDIQFFVWRGTQCRCCVPGNTNSSTNQCCIAEQFAAAQ